MVWHLFKKKAKALSVGAMLGIAAVTGNASESQRSDYSYPSVQSHAISKQIYEVVATSGVKARAGPSVNSKYLGFSLKSKTDVYAVALHTDVQGNTWAHVLSPTSSERFWICITYQRKTLAKQVSTYDYSGDLVTQAYQQYSEVFSQGYSVDPLVVPKLQYIKNKLHEKVGYYNQYGEFRQASRLQVAKELAEYVDLPVELIISIWYRENAKMPTNMYFHNGKTLGKPITLIGKSYFFTETEFFLAAKNTFNSKYYSTLKKRLGLTKSSSDKAAIATFVEAHRGFMHRQKGGFSPYTYSGTEFSTAHLEHNGKAIGKDSRPGFLAIIKMFRS